MSQTLKQYFSLIGRQRIPARLGIKMSSIHEAERVNRAAASWYKPLCEWASEAGIEPPDASLFNFRDLLDAPDIPAVEHKSTKKSLTDAA